MLRGDTIKKIDNLEKYKEGIFINGTNEFWYNVQYQLFTPLLAFFSQLNKSDTKLDTLLSVIFWLIHCEPL